MNTLKIEALLAKKYKYKPLKDGLSDKYRQFFKDNIPSWLNENGADQMLATKSGELIAYCYDRIVIGDYGAFIEFSEASARQAAFIVAPGQEYRINDERYSKNVKYIWLTVNDGSKIKIYYQKKPVLYADYKPNKYYVSVHEVKPYQMDNGKTINGITYHLNKPYYYMYDNGNSSKCIVSLVRFLESDWNIGEARFLKVINDDSGNGYFTYLYNTNQTMNISLQYLHEIEDEEEMEQIKVKYHNKELTKIEKISVGDWIDLRAAEDISLKAGEFKLISLGISMKLPEGYEAHIVPRSSTFKTWGVLQTNHMGVVDNSYCGNNDIWRFPALATRDTEIKTNDRICQFRIIKRQPELEFIEVEDLGEKDRGGFGSTGTN